MAPLLIPISGHAALEVSSRSGSLEVIAEPRSDVAIERGAKSMDDIEIGDLGRILIRPRSSHDDIVVRCPIGSDVSAANGSGRITLEGSFGRVRLSARSGRIEVGSADDLEARAISGGIDVDEVRGTARLSTKNGAITVAAARAVKAQTMHGRIELHNVRGPVSAATVNGRIQVAMQTDADVSAKSVSGRIDVTYPPDVRPDTRCRTVVGRAKVELDEGADCRCALATVSGRVTVAAAS